MNRFQVIVSILFLTTSAYSKEYFTPCNITLKSGEQFDCYVSDVYNILDYVEIKRDLNSEKEKVKNETISAILVKTKKSTFLLLQKPVFISDKDKWLILTQKCTEFSLMGYVNSYHVGKEGQLVMLFDKYQAYYIIQDHEGGDTYGMGEFYKKHTRIHKRWDKHRLRYVKEFFSNDPEIEKFLEDKKRMSQKEFLEYIEYRC